MVAVVVVVAMVVVTVAVAVAVIVVYYREYIILSCGGGRVNSSERVGGDSDGVGSGRVGDGGGSGNNSGCG